MKLYLIRHAQSANNAVCAAGNEAARTPDPEITEIGHQQSQKLADFLIQGKNEPRQPSYLADLGHLEKTPEKTLRFSHLYCSLMTRSILTANYIAKATGIQLQARDDIFERKGLYEVNDQGVMEGVEGPNRSYFEHRFPDLLLPSWLNENGWWNRPAETDDQFCNRVTASLTSILDIHGNTDDHVALVTHGDYIDQLINTLFNVTRTSNNYENHWEANWVSHNTSLSRVDMESGSKNVVYLNRIDHLDNELMTW